MKGQPRLDRVKFEWTDEGTDMACQAVAEVSYPINDQGDRRLEWFTSGGLHGIQTPINPAYRKGIEDDELADLRDHLSHFGMTWTDEAWQLCFKDR
jgi:hypothetical protein